MSVLSSEGFAECKRETTTNRRDSHPAGGIWQGVDPRTGSVASAVWVNHAAWPHALVYVEVDGESLTDALGCAARRESHVDEKGRVRVQPGYAAAGLGATMGQPPRCDADSRFPSLTHER